MGRVVTDVGLEKRIEQGELKKHAATIHCSNTLSLLQRKISNALLYHAYKELLQKEEHEISIKQLCKLIGYHGNNHSAIKEALKGLLSTVIEWNVVNDSMTEDWTASSILASVCLKGPLCLYAYSPRMKQLLHSPSMFGKVSLVIQSRFKSNYGLALYENCIRYCGLPYTKWFDIEIFRKLMGVPSDKYPVFRDFKRRVLDKSVEEVNTYSDLIVEPEIFREKRQVTKIRFKLQERAKKVRLGKDKVGEGKPLEEFDLSISRRLIDQYGFSNDQARALITEYTADFISEKMTLIESSRNYQQGKVHNLAGYLLSALKNNFQSMRSATEDQSDIRKKESELVGLQRRVEDIRERYFLYKEKTIDQVLQMLTVEKREEFMAQFREHAAHSIKTVLRLQKNKYTSGTVLESPQIKALLRQFALETIPEIKSSLLSLEKYIEGLSIESKTTWQQYQSLTPDSERLKIGEGEPV